MNLFLYVLVMVIAFSLDNIATPINAHFGKRAGSFWAELFYLACGAILIPVALSIQGTPLITDSFSQLPWYIFLSGVINIFLLAGHMALVRKIGVGALFASMAVGRFSGSLIVDHFNLLNTGRISITPVRLLGALLIVLGSLMISVYGHRASTRQESAEAPLGKGEEKVDASKKSLPLLVHMFFGVVLGAGVLTMQSLNTISGSVIGTARAVWVFLCEGAVLALILALLLQRKGARELRRMPLYFLFPGLFNVFIVALPIYVIPVLGAGLYAGIEFTVLCSTSIIVDMFGLWSMPKIKLNAIRCVGAIVMITGVLLMIG